MGNEVPAVVPRYRPKPEQFDRQVSMDEMMVTTPRDHGMRTFGAIEESYQAPGFGIKNGKKVPIGQTTPSDPAKMKSIGDLEEEANAQYEPKDCVKCNAKASVQPLSQEMIEWQCSECSQNYVMKGA